MTLSGLPELLSVRSALPERPWHAQSCWAAGKLQGATSCCDAMAWWQG